MLIGPLDALPAGRLAVVIDPSGAAISLWEPGEREGAQVVNEPNTWTMSSLHTPDAAAANVFYGAVFGWEPEPFGQMTLYPAPRLCRRRREGNRSRATSSPRWHRRTPRNPPHWNVNLRVADADAITQRAAELGGTVIAAPMDTPGFRSAVLGDPQGAVFSVSSLVVAP